MVKYLSMVQLSQKGCTGYNVADFSVTIAVAVPVTVAVTAVAPDRSNSGNVFV